MSIHELEKTQLREYLTRAHQLVGEKVEIKEEGCHFIHYYPSL